MADVTLISEAGAIDISRPTQTDLSALQYHYVKHDSSELVVACGANEKPLGILQNAPVGTATAPAIATVRIGGMSKLVLAETVISGNFLTSTSGSTGEVCDAAGEEYGSKSLTSGESGDKAAVIICFGETEASDA